MGHTPKRIAIVGTGHRAQMFFNGITARPNLQLVAFCEPNPIRAEYYNAQLEALNRPKVPIYKPEQFTEMIKMHDVDTMVVTCIDGYHDQYIVPAINAGVNVITEKPMTTNVEKCRAINKACANSPSANLTVTFNYRYNPVHEKVKQLLSAPANSIGKILSVHFEWLLDTVHGADYFRRWHRQKENSGGLMVHKSGHHFDLVNWWIDSEPVEVAGMGKLAFYGDKAGQKHGWAKSYERARWSEESKDDPFALHMDHDPVLKSLYTDAEGADGYHRDQNVFAPNISIEDDMSLLVRYKNGATMTYHLTAYSPWEGYRVMFNGSHGRLELEVVESTHRTVSSTSGLTHGTTALPNAGKSSITVQSLFSSLPAKSIEIPSSFSHAGHGGGDQRMLSVLFGPLEGEKVDTGDASKQHAGVRDGTMALAVGLAANESFRSGSFVKIAELDLGC